MKFLDEAKVYVESGAGGRGCVSFLRTRHNPFGGPNGGNGGKGADICLVADPSLNTLIDYRYNSRFIAPAGQNGASSRCAGADGKTLFLPVPCGTRAWDEEQENVLAEVIDPGQVSLIFPGGRGGLGNTCFKSSTNRSPRQTTPAEEGIGAWVWLQMRMVADVGLIGQPNVGKSSLLRAISRATPKIGNYPFTTLYPNLGVVAREYEEAVFEDVPGLIRGASHGKGLGDRFLRHAQKCQIFLHVVSLTDDDVLASYQTVYQELCAFDADFSKKQHCLILSKSDAVTADEIREKSHQLVSLGLPIFVTSSVTREGLDNMLQYVFEILRKNK